MKTKEDIDFEASGLIAESKEGREFMKEMLKTMAPHPKFPSEIGDIE